jgi:TolB-like protein/Flp pilus assembly protein TadD/tRNA A-37 threonylcarbamoyl transferase component Bud32
VSIAVPHRVSHFAIEELIGAGGMAVVYKARDEKLGRHVALKFIRADRADADARRRFLAEARAAASLDHPNICTIYEAGETSDGDLFIAMALYGGETLDRLLLRGPLPAERAIGIALQTARGLAAAHEELIVHRDIKPANLMITEHDTVKILDFGLAQLRGSASAALAGTPDYMAPEQFLDEAIDPRSDIWSLGAVLYEMVSGRRPRGAPQPPLPEASLQRILERAMAPLAENRYDRVETLAEELILLRSALDPGAVTQRRVIASRKASIAVLPFADMSATRDQEHLCDGIAEEILRALTRIPNLHVASRTSAFRFKSAAADIREIGALLNVETVLEGSVRRAGDRVRVSAQLVNVADGYRRWYERFDGEIRDILAIEDEIAERIAASLELTFAGGQAVPRILPSPDAAEAYSLYLQGRRFFHQLRRKGLEIAIQTFQRALDLDPNFARAYAGIAECHAFLRLYFGAGREAVEAAERAGARAIELAPGAAEAREARGLALFVAGNYDEAETELRHAIEIDAALYDPHYISGRMSFMRGRVEEAAAHYERACAIAPESYDAWYLLGMCYRRLGRAADARNAELECIEAVKRTTRYHPDDTRALTMGAAVLAALGEPDSAASWVERALGIDRDEPVISYNAACVYTALGRFDDAINCLGSARTTIAAAWMRNDPDLDPLRGDARFRELLEPQVKD